MKPVALEHEAMLKAAPLHQHLLSISHSLGRALPYLTEHVSKSDPETISEEVSWCSRTFCCCIRRVVIVTGRKFTYLQSFLWGYWVSFSQTQEPQRPLHLVLLRQSSASPEERNHLYLLQFSFKDWLLQHI